MRVIAGAHRGRTLQAPRGAATRPTSDRVREALFSILGDMGGLVVLDLFAGSGALGLEALSRGAASVDFVENAASSIKFIQANAQSLGAGAEAAIHRVDAIQFVQKLPAHAYDVAFADPPYDHGFATRLAELWIQTPFADIFGVEHRLNEHLPGEGERRKYGSTVITLFRSA